MHRYKCAITIVLLSFLPNIAVAQSVFMIGNSLTWDTVPSQIEGDVQWHIFCGRNLQYIFDNPGDHCIGTSTRWDDALVNKNYDIVVVQPHLGTTLAQDTAIITTWMQMQPGAQFIVHPGWAWHENFSDVYTAGNPDNMMRPNPEYIGDLIESLENENTGREIEQTYSHEILWSIYQDIENGVGPFTQLSDLYRDHTHMSYSYGQYLMNNVMRHALGQPLRESQSLDQRITAYLDAKVLGIPEPSHIAIICLALPWVARRRR